LPIRTQITCGGGPRRMTKSTKSSSFDMMISRSFGRIRRSSGPWTPQAQRLGDARTKCRTGQRANLPILAATAHPAGSSRRHLDVGRPPCGEHQARSDVICLKIREVREYRLRTRPRRKHVEHVTHTDPKRSNARPTSAYARSLHNPLQKLVGRRCLRVGLYHPL
jgi:hypothetical protein